MLNVKFKFIKYIKYQVVAFPLASILIYLITFPSILVYFGFASSFALGTCISSFLLTIFCQIFYRKKREKILICRLNKYIFIILICASISLHSIIAMIFNEIDYARFLYSLLLIVIEVFSIFVLSETFLTIDEGKIDFAIHQILWFLNVIAIISILGLRVDGVNSSFKSIFPFTEPSFFALIYIPIMMYCCVTSKTTATKLQYLIIGFVLAYILQNLTFLIGCFLTAIIILKKLYFICLTIISSFVIPFLDFSYFTTRLDFTENNINLSSLVYIQGWQLIGEALKLTNFWGLGFQQLGIRNLNVNATSLIFSQLGFDLNLSDGGFTLAKIICEFGIFGIILFIIFIHVYYKAFLYLRNQVFEINHNNFKIIFINCLIMGSIIEFLIRGSGYYSSTILLTCCGFLSIKKIKERSK